MNQTLKRHHEVIQERTEQESLAYGVTLGLLSSVWLIFALIDIAMGVM